MIRSYFWKDALNKGAVLGVLMLVSAIFELSAVVYGGTMGWVSAMGFEYLAVMAIYLWLMYRFAKNFSLQVMSMQREVKSFTYAQGFFYVVTLSILAGVLVGLGSYLFRHFVVGHDRYVEATIHVLQDALSQAQLPSSAMGAYKQLFAQLASAPEPTLFGLLMSSVWNYMLSGTFVGLIVAGAIKREPQLFNSDEDAE